MTNASQVSIKEAIQSLASQLEPVGTEVIPIARANGRVLVSDLLADRDSPALDVSAMDGYAIRITDISEVSDVNNREQTLPVTHVVTAGSPPPNLKPSSAIRIFTGAPVPSQTDCVVKREDTQEFDDERVTIKLPVEQLKPGLNIRRQGENVKQGQLVLPAGACVGAAQVAALASFGPQHVTVRQRVRVSILNTGDELARAGDAVEPWTIRDSNGPTLRSWLAQLEWCTPRDTVHVGDTLAKTEAAIQAAVTNSDAVVLTGGVSMGDTDYVPQAIRNLGGEIVFHRLPIRPGRPVLGARLQNNGQNKLILGLPGNPVSVAVTSRVVGEPLLRFLAGISNHQQPSLQVSVSNPDSKTISLVWFRLVRVTSDGQAELVENRGSGDLVALAKSSGFVAIPAEKSCSGRLDYHPW